MESRRGWANIGRVRLRQIQRQVQYRLGPLPSDLRRYQTRFLALARGAWRESSRSELQAALQGARVVFSADFHAFAQSQRSHLRLLREHPVGKPLVLALECFESRHQTLVESFLRGRLSEGRFLKRIQWRERWHFPFSHYRPLLELARERGWPVLALNSFFQQRSQRALARRDRHSARVLATSLRRRPHDTHFVVYGEWHLAHLPQEVERWGVRDWIRVQQNNEQLYFRLAVAGRENQTEVLRRGSRDFCLNDSPPWVKWQSYLMFLEQTYDVDLEDGDVDLDFTEQVAGFARWAARDLGLAEPAVDGLSVYTELDRGLRARLRRQVGTETWRLLSALYQRDVSFFVPQLGWGYLSRHSINHAATLAGFFLHAQACGRKKSLVRFPRDLEGAIWVQAVAFFVSKLINHKRKVDSALDTRSKLASTSPRWGRQALRIALRQSARELALVEKVARRSRSARASMVPYIEASRLLGEWLGDRLYQAFHRGDLDAEELRRWLAIDPARPGFDRHYWSIVRRLPRRAADPVKRQVRHDD